jgi:hypothetical protein
LFDFRRRQPGRKAELLIRAKTDRCLEATHRKLFEELAAAPLVYSSELIRGDWSGVVRGATGVMSGLGRGADGWLVCREGVVQGCG